MARADSSLSALPARSFAWAAWLAVPMAVPGLGGLEAPFVPRSGCSERSLESAARLTGCQLAAIEVVDDAGNVAPSLPVRWNPLVFLHRPGAGVVCCQSLGGVSVVTQQAAREDSGCRRQYCSPDRSYRAPRASPRLRASIASIPGHPSAKPPWDCSRSPPG